MYQGRNALTAEYMRIDMNETVRVWYTYVWYTYVFITIAPCIRLTVSFTSQHLFGRIAIQQHTDFRTLASIVEKMFRCQGVCMHITIVHVSSKRFLLK